MPEEVDKEDRRFHPIPPDDIKIGQYVMLHRPDISPQGPLVVLAVSYPFIVTKVPDDTYSTLSTPDDHPFIINLLQTKLYFVSRQFVEMLKRREPSSGKPDWLYLHETDTASGSTGTT